MAQRLKAIVRRPAAAKSRNLTVRVGSEAMERLDALLGAYKRRWPLEASITRSWLVLELLEYGMGVAESELAVRR